MPRAIRYAFTALILAFLVPTAPGETGRDGGIVILPNARHITSVLLKPRAKYDYANVGTVRALMPASLANCTAIVKVDGGSSTLAVVNGRNLTLSGAALRALDAAGVGSLQIQLLNTQMLGMLLEIRFKPGEPGMLLLVF